MTTTRFAIALLELPGEPADGVDNLHSHAAEPRTARFFLSYAF